MSQPTPPSRVDIDDDDVQFNDGGRLCYRDVPFTGEVVEISGDTITELRRYRDGQAHGVQLTFHADGSRRSEYTAVDGGAVGGYTRWYSGGQVAERKEFDEFGVPRKVEEWDENEVLKPGSIDSW